jgi:hypothetical protein
VTQELGRTPAVTPISPSQVSAARHKDRLLRRAVRQARIQEEATIAGARSRAVVRCRRGRRLLVGPWLAEVGFELLYWIPFARKLMLRAGIPPDRVLVLSRGGVEAWYGDAFGAYLDLYDLFDPDELHLRQRERISISGGQKHTAVTALDREAVTRAQRRLGEDFAVLHPSLMFRRFRPVWMRRRTTAAVMRESTPAAIRTLPRPDGLPARYMALKLYSSDCLPVDRPTAESVIASLHPITEGLPLAVLSAGAQVDDHVDLASPEDSPGQVDLAVNLRRQTAIIQHAEKLICTYGGFAYLGVLSGVPTVGLYEHANFNVLHLDMLSHAVEQLPPTRAAGLSLLDIDHLRGGSSDLARRQEPSVAYSFTPPSEEAPR